MPAHSIKTVYVRSPRLASLPAVLMIWGTSSSTNAPRTPHPDDAAKPAPTTPLPAPTRTRKPGT